MPDELTPSTNIEKFLAKTAGESVELPEPATRIEKYLSKIASEQTITDITDTWLGEHIDPSTGYVLDSTLTLDNAAPPASAVGDLKSAIDDVNSDAKRIPLTFTIDGTGYVRYADGTITDSTNYSHTDYIDVGKYGQLAFKHYGATGAKSTINGGLAFYDENKTYISGVQNKCNQASAGYLSYYSLVTVPDNAKYVRFTTATNTSTYGEFALYGITKLWIAMQNNEISSLIEPNPVGAVVWEDIKGTGTYTKYNGWEKGYWTSSNEQGDSKYMMRYWTFFTTESWAISKANKLLFEVPDTYCIILQGFGGSNYATREENYTITGRMVITLTEGLRYRMHLRQMDFDNMSASGRGSDQILAKLKLIPIPKHGLLKSRVSGGRDYFTVNINRAWPDQTATGKTNAEGSDSVDIQCVIQVPTSYSPAKKAIPLIMFCHGASSNVTTTKWYENNANFNLLLDAFNDAGYAVFDVANTRNKDGGFYDWGCLPLMEAYIKAWEYIKANYNVEKRLYIFSDSMGTCACLNMLKWYGSEVITALMTAPRPICQARYETLTGDSKTDFEAAFGITTGEWEDRLNGFNHYENIVTINDVPHILENFPPVKVMVGQDDSSFLTETRAYYQALANNGNYVNYREVAGADHAKMTFLSETGLRAEAVAWFDRFKCSISNPTSNAVNTGSADNMILTE